MTKRRRDWDDEHQDDKVPWLEQALSRAPRRFAGSGLRDVIEGAEAGAPERTAGKAEHDDELERRCFYAELLGMLQKHRRWKRSWVAHQYRARFGGWPPWEWQGRVTAIEPSADTKAWCDLQHYIFRRKRAEER